MLLRGFHALAWYVLRDGGAKDLQRAEYHFNAAMQLAVSFIWDRKIGPRCSKRGVQLQTFSDLPLNHPRNLHGLWDTCDFRSSFVNMRRWNWRTVTTCRGIPGSLITFPFVGVHPQMESEHQVITKQPWHLFVRRNTKMFLHFVKKHESLTLTFLNGLLFMMWCPFHPSLKKRIISANIQPWKQNASNFQNKKDQA